MKTSHHPASLMGRFVRAVDVMGVKAAADARGSCHWRLHRQLDPEKRDILSAAEFFEYLVILREHAARMGYQDGKWADPLRAEAERLGYLLVPVGAAAAGADGLYKTVVRANTEQADIGATLLRIEGADSPGGRRRTPEELRELAKEVLEANAHNLAVLAEAGGSVE